MELKKILGMKKMRKRLFLTLEIVLILLLPVLQSHPTHALPTTDEMTTFNNWNEKWLGEMALGLQEEDPMEYELIWEPNRAQTAIHAVALSPDEQLLALGGGHLSGDNVIHLYAWSGSQWQHVWDAGDGVIDGSVLALAIDDLDGDGIFEVVAGSAGGKIYVYTMRTWNPDFVEATAEDVYHLAWESTTEIRHKVWDLVIDDLDEDSRKEIIVGAGDGVHIFEYVTRRGYHYRRMHSQEYQEVWNSGEALKLIRAVSTGDTDGDQFREVICGSEDHRVYIFENALDVWSADPPHANNFYELSWESGQQIFGPIQALTVGDINPASESDEIVVSAYDRGVFVFEKTAEVNITTTLLFSAPTGVTVVGPTVINSTVVMPSSRAAQNTLPLQPITQPVLLPGNVSGLALTYIKDRIMTMTKLYRPIKYWENPQLYDPGAIARYPIDSYTDWVVTKSEEPVVQDPWPKDATYSLFANSAMTREADGNVTLIQEGGKVVLDFGRLEAMMGGGNSAPDLTILLGTDPTAPIYQPIDEFKIAQPIMPDGLLQPMQILPGDKLQPIQMVKPIGSILKIVEPIIQDAEIAISQDGSNWTVVSSSLIKPAQWTLGERVDTQLEIQPSLVIDLDPVLVATQWNSYRYLRITNTGTAKVLVDTCFGILYRPPAETLSIHLSPMNLRRPGTATFPTEYDDRDIIVLGMQDGRLLFYDYQNPNNASCIYDTFEDSRFSLGTGIWDLVSIKNSPAQRGYICGTYPAIQWVENYRIQFGNEIYWSVKKVWDNLERLRHWTAGEAVELADPDGDGDLEIIAGSWDNNVYLFENIVNGTYYDAWSSPDLAHIVRGQSDTGMPYASRVYDDARHIAVGDTDGDGQSEIVVATNRTLFIFERQGTEANPNQYGLIWKADIAPTVEYPITGLALGDDLDDDGWGEIIIIVKNVLYVLEATRLEVEFQPIQQVLNLTNPKLKPIIVEPIDVELNITQPVQPFIVEPIINQPVQPIIPQSGINPTKVFINHYEFVFEWQLPSSKDIVTQVITEDIDNDGRGEIILAGAQPEEIFYSGFVLGLENVGNNLYGLEPVGTETQRRRTWGETHTYGITSIAVDDQDRDGQKELFCGTYGVAVFETSGNDIIRPVKASVSPDIGWVGELAVGDTDRNGIGEILVAGTNVSLIGLDLPRNIISVLEYRRDFEYELRFNKAFREPINVRDIVIGDTNGNDYDEIICSAPGGYVFSYEYVATVEISEFFKVQPIVIQLGISNVTIIEPVQPIQPSQPFLSL